MNNFINMKGCSSNNIKLEKGDSITKKKTLIHVDSFRVSLCNSAFIIIFSGNPWSIQAHLQSFIIYLPV